MFSTLYGTYFSFEMHHKMLSAICFNLDQSKILSSGNGVKASPLYMYIKPESGGRYYSNGPLFFPKINKTKKKNHPKTTRGPRWLWLAHQNILADHSHFFFRFQRRIYENFSMSLTCK